MAGALQLRGRRWSAPSSIFYWVVDTAADRVADAGTHASLREVSEHNLGWLDVDELPPAGREELLRTLAGLPDVAEQVLPASPARLNVLRQIRELADVAGGHAAGLPTGRQ